MLRRIFIVWRVAPAQSFLLKVEAAACQYRTIVLANAVQFPLPSGGGLGWGLVPPKILADRLDNAFDVRQHIIVPEAQNTITLPEQESGSPFIFCAVRMLATIDFDNQPCQPAAKIRDIRADRVLAAKMLMLQLMVPQPGPQLLFSFRHIAPQTASLGDEWICCKCCHQIKATGNRAVGNRCLLEWTSVTRVPPPQPSP